jgi:CRP/FNR family transcriptional regulator, polysaccharide utilization system transcription regulator
MKKHIDNVLCEKCRHTNQSLIRLCTKQEVEEMNASKTCVSYRRGEALFYSGTLPLGFFCVNTGTIKVVKEASGGKEQIVRIVKAGDVVGYRSLIMQQRYSSSAFAIEDSKVCLISKDEFVKLSANNRKFYDELVRMLCEELENSQNKMTEIAYKPVRGRIAEALIFLAQLSVPQGVINLTRDDLASFVGTVKETVIRVLSELKNERFIEIDKRTIKVLNLAALEKLSGMYD